MKEGYPSLSKAIQDLQQNGYETDFNYILKQDSSNNLKAEWEQGNLRAVKYYRFEGMSNPGDDSILYVIEGASGAKGILVDNYSGTEDQVPIEMIKKLKITHEE